MLTALFLLRYIHIENSGFKTGNFAAKAIAEMAMKADERGAASSGKCFCTQVCGCNGCQIMGV